MPRGRRESRPHAKVMLSKRKQRHPSRLTIKQRKAMTWCMNLGYTETDSRKNLQKLNAAPIANTEEGLTESDPTGADFSGSSFSSVVINRLKKNLAASADSCCKADSNHKRLLVDETLEIYSDALVLQLPGEPETVNDVFPLCDLKAVADNTEFSTNVELSHIVHAILCLEQVKDDSEGASTSDSPSGVRGALFLELKTEAKSVLSFQVRIDCARPVRAILHNPAFLCVIFSVAHFGLSTIFTIRLALRRKAIFDPYRHTSRLVSKRPRASTELLHLALYLREMQHAESHNINIEESARDYDALLAKATSHKEATVGEFYQLVQVETSSRPRDLPIIDYDTIQQLIRVHLRLYQIDAVRWMVQREAEQPTRTLQEVIDTNLIAVNRLNCDDEHKLPQLVHYCPFNATFFANLQAAATVRGGILADEMGLGKTVELLCAVLLHRRPSHELGSDDFFYRAYQPGDSETLSPFHSAGNDSTVRAADSAGSNRSAREVDGLRITSGRYWTPRDWSNVKRLACICGFERETEETRRRVYEEYDAAEQTALKALEKRRNRKSAPGGADAEQQPDADVSKRRKSSAAMTFSVAVKRKKLENEMEIECRVCGMRQHAKCVRFDCHSANAAEYYVCPLCIQNAPVRLPIGATLIIVPATLVGQWLAELRKLVATRLRVLLYDGVNGASAASIPRSVVHAGAGNAGAEEFIQVERLAGYVQPMYLAKFDVILVTYETLRNDVHHAPQADTAMSVSRYGFRAPKRYVAAPCPLFSVIFWRICLDEAQMVESVTSIHAEMTAKLHATIRWCITGTPLQTCVRDLFGLFTFLGCHPFTTSLLFDDLLYRPFCSLPRTSLEDAKKRLYVCGLVRLCSELMWRTVKADVAEQMLLPPHREISYSVEFSPFERHFYNRQLELADRGICESLHKAELSTTDYSSRLLSSLERDTFDSLLSRLTSVRQACCHPQAVRSDFLSLAIGSQNVVSMHELLRAMLARTRIECEEAHREFIGALNGLAALALLQSNRREAARLYREAFGSIRSNESLFRTDMLQQLHIAHNLQELLQDHANEVDGRTLNDDLLPELANQIRNRYLARADATVRIAASRFSESHSEVTQLRNTVDSYESQYRSVWWLDVINDAVERRLDTNLLTKVHNDLAAEKQRTRRPTSAATVLDAVTDTRGLTMAITMTSENIDTLRTAAFASIDEIARVLKADWRILERTKRPPVRPLNQTASTSEAEVAAEKEPVSMSIEDFNSVVKSPQVQQAISCCLREDAPGVPKLRGAGVCLFCRSETAILNYENELFVHYEPVKKEARKVRVRGADAEDPDLLAALSQSAAESGDTSTIRHNESIMNEKTVRQHFGLILNAQDASASSQAVGGGGDRAVESIWFDCELLTVLKCLSSFQKTKRGSARESDSLANAARAHLKAFSCMKEELIRLRNLWIELRHEAAAFDELNMAVSRTRLQTDVDNDRDAFLSVHSAAYKRARFADVAVESGSATATRQIQAQRTCLDAIHEADIEPQRLNLIGNRAQAESELRRKKGQIFYLQNLEKGASLIDERGVNPDCCPVCQSQLGIQWNVLICGHCLCTACTNRMHMNHGAAKQNPNATLLKCPVCRENVPRSGMTLVKLENKHTRKQQPSTSADAEKDEDDNPDKEEEDEQEVRVVGDTSSKVYDLVRRVLLLVRKAKRASPQNPSVKLLVFSNWAEVLDIIAKALTDNGIDYRAAYPSHRFAQSLAAFKQDASIVALLMPFRSCASGLNLTEASHVFLVEPVLNVAIDKQAVGRIQRIGQLRPTFVHRFIVGDSIEQKLDRINNEQSQVLPLPANRDGPQSPPKHLRHQKGKSTAESEESGCSKLTIAQFLQFFNESE